MCAICKDKNLGLSKMKICRVRWAERPQIDVKIDLYLAEQMSASFELLVCVNIRFCLPLKARPLVINARGQFSVLLAESA